MKIKIDKKPVTKIILLVSILLTFVAINIMLLHFAVEASISFLSIFLLLFGIDSGVLPDSINWVGIFFTILVILSVILLVLIFIYIKKKKKIITPKESNNKCINCNNEMSNINHLCDHCGFNSKVEYTCDNCYAINNINSSSCLVCGQGITKENKIKQTNKKITFNILKIVIIVIVSFIYFNPIIGTIISLSFGLYYCIKIIELSRVLKILKNK